MERTKTIEKGVDLCAKLDRMSEKIDNLIVLLMQYGRREGLLPHDYMVPQVQNGAKPAAMVPHISSSTSPTPLVVVAPVPAPLATVVPVSLPVMALCPVTTLSPLPSTTFAPPTTPPAPSLPTYLPMTEPAPAPIPMHTPRAPVPPPAPIPPLVMKPTPLSLKSHGLSMVDMSVPVRESIIHSMGLDNQHNDTRQYTIGGATVGMLGVKTWDVF